MPDQPIIAAAQVRGPELSQFGRWWWPAGLLIAVAGLGLIAWTMSRHGEQNDQSNLLPGPGSGTRHIEDSTLRDEFTNSGTLTRVANRGPITLFGPDFDPSLNADVLRFRRLEEALQAALDGSTIEITGPGPFIVEPCRLDGRHLRIVAAAKSQPVLVFNDTLGDQRTAMFETDASLILEGLELRAAQFHQASPRQNPRPLILARGPELRLIHCRLRGGSGSTQPLIRAEVLECLLSDCEIFAGRGVGLEWGAGPCRQLVCQNNLFAGGCAIQVNCPTPSPPDSSLELTHNTCVNLFPMQFHFAAEQPDADTSPTDSVLTVVAESNLFDARQSVLGVVRPMS